MDNEIMEDKVKLLFGKRVIVTEGDFKGVTGILVNVQISNDNYVIKSSTPDDNKYIIRFDTTPPIILCRVVVNDKNTIEVPIECISSTSDL
jgi:hypothetical protein